MTQKKIEVIIAYIGVEHYKMTSKNFRYLMWASIAGFFLLLVAVLVGDTAEGRFKKMVSLNDRWVDSIVVDRVTHCQYFSGGGRLLSVVYGSDGKPVCGMQ